MIVVPPLSADGLRHISVCSFAEFDGGDDRKRAAYSAGQPRYSSLFQGQTKIYIRRLIEVDSDGEGHFHVEAAIAEHFRKPPRENDELESVLSPVPDIDGTAVRAIAVGRFFVGVETVVAKRIAMPLLGVSVDVSGYDLSLAGCTFDVQGDGPLFRVRWSVRENEQISVELSLYLDLTVGNDFLTIAAEHVEEAMRNLRSREPLRVLSNDKT